MEDKHHIARATALLAANAYALIQTMAIISADPALSHFSTLFVFVPAFGIMCAYNMLEPPPRRWEEIVAACCVGVMLLLWVAREWTS